ncbi:hypothetical protein POX_b03052 [Penicillium oxalicum]|uniref:Uncharacterized protein n=1 Tax=Penicillium oxalicum (strain 114-2 / CGMCC 5302) TaxID=933388 RepID=S7ZGY8_PENO1|nr:hypothetical protein POX_b03052 [Penicillium oxalicum]EPS29930.1 hypothetical protein PDE_04880 [Penicillium oxalicum 114-2]KAI2793006.1 hypothetical protein POX_b03052 [Penicillium oxalicum]
MRSAAEALPADVGYTLVQLTAGSRVGVCRVVHVRAEARLARVPSRDNLHANPGGSTGSRKVGRDWDAKEDAAPVDVDDVMAR